MKYKRLLSLTMSAALLFGSVVALPEGVFETSSTITASALVEGDFEYKCYLDNDWAMITKYNGTDSHVTIPSTIGGMTVVCINAPFSKEQNIKSVYLPADVNFFLEAADTFGGCPELESITVDPKHKYLFSSEGVLYGKDDSGKPDAMEYCPRAKSGSITILDGVNFIYSDALSGCNKITALTIPGSIKEFYDFEFSGFSSLKEVTIKNGVTSISDGLFDGCTSLKSVTIPSSVKSIGMWAFQSCSSLTSVSIPDGVKNIGDSAFNGCTNLKSVTIPKSVTRISEDAFDKNITIRCNKGSAAEKYAKANGIKYILIDTIVPKATRFAGANRYETASVISTKMFKQSDTVIVATGLTFHDAMVAVPLASAYNAPLLLATEKHITAQTEAELKRLKAKNVIVVSTNGAIGAKAKAEFKAAKYNMTYIEGKTCFEAAAKVAKALQDKTKTVPDTIFFATDSAFADALSASPVAAIKGAPIMYLKNKGSIDSATANFLKSVKGKVKNAYIIGGDGVISDAMMKNVANALGLTVNKTVQRVAGKNRYETCVAVNDKFKSVLTGDGICVAKGLDFPDALAGGVYAAATKQALFLADGKKLQDCQNTYLKSKNAGKITVFGGIGAVPDELVKLIAQASV